MPVKNSPVSIQSRSARETAQAFRDMADRAERGDCVGAVVGYFDQKRDGKFFIVGHAEEKPREAVWLVSNLKRRLLDGTV